MGTSSAPRRRACSRARRFVEFVAQQPAALKGALAESKRVLMRSRLGRWFGERNCTRFCDVRVAERDGEVTFLVIHGRGPRNTSIIENDTARSRLSFIPDKQDTIVYDVETGRLAVNARWPVEHDTYRRLVGEVFFKDADHFLAHEVYTGDPLVEDGAAALSVAGIPGLVGAALKKFEVHDTSEPAERLLWRGPDLGRKLGSEEARVYFDGRVVSYLRLALALRGRKRLLSVEITPPNKVTYDRRVGDAVVREFLLARRFMRLPDAEALPRAAGAR